MKSAPLAPRIAPAAVLDLGSNKIACFVAQPDSANTLRVVGVGHQLSKGIKGGVITDITEAETSIISAVHAAEQMAGSSIEEVLVGVSLPQMQSRHVRVELALGNDGVTEQDLLDIMREGRDAVEEKEHLLHCLPFSYALDDHKGIADPRGMLGRVLVADILLVTVPSNLLRNLTHCMGRCTLEVKEYVAAPYASALACLEQDERDLGCVLLDLGGSTTGYAVYTAGKLVHVGCVPVGGNHITQDIAHGLSTGIQQAERLKTVHGSAILNSTDDQMMVNVPQLGEEQDDSNYMPRSAIIHIIRPRLEEIFELVKNGLEAAGLERVSGRRMVLTGGGSQLLGIADLATKVFGKQVRIAKARNGEGLADAVSGPAFSTPLGMLDYAATQQAQRRWLTLGHGTGWRRTLMRIAEWFK